MTFTENDLAAELADRYPPLPDRRPGGVTVADMSKVWRVGYRQASYRLNELVDKGELTAELSRLEDGRSVMVYYKKETSTNVP